MAQAVLYIDDVRIRQRGFTAPKRSGQIQSWFKTLNKLFRTELVAHGVSPRDAMQDYRATPDEIRIAAMGYGFVVDRRADPLAVNR